MAVRASVTVTLSCYRDTEKVVRYYLLQSSTLSAPDAPTAYPPAGDWTDTEPGYTEGSTGSLYFTDCSVFSDGTFQYSAVSLSSSYEAAKAAYNKAAAAASAAASVETRTTTLETELETVQGQITAKVWQTDITEITDPLGESVTTLEDQYAQLVTDVNSVTLSVGDLTTTVTDQGTSIDTITGELALKVDKDDNDQVVSMLNASANVITLTANRLVIESDNFSLTSEGKIAAASGTIGGWYIGATRIQSSETIDIGSAESGMLLVNEDEQPYIHTQDADGNMTFQVTRSGSVTMTGDLTVANTITMSSDTAYITGPSRVRFDAIIGAHRGVVTLNNSYGYYSQDSSGDNMRILWVSDSDIVRAGNGSYPLRLDCSSLMVNAYAARVIVSIQSVSVSTSSTVDSGSTGSATGTMTAVSGASYLLLPQRANYGYVTAVSYSGTTVTATIYNASGSSHTLGGTVIVLAYI